MAGPVLYYYGKPLGQRGAHPPDTAPEWELFDMQQDPREMHNLYHDPAYGKLVARLKGRLNRLQREAGDTPA